MPKVKTIIPKKILENLRLSLPSGARAKIAREVGCAGSTVTRVLAGVCYNEQIYNLAVEYGNPRRIKIKKKKLAKKNEYKEPFINEVRR